MMTMIGIISLAGIVVNNAIVLIDYTNVLIDRKKAELGLDAQAGAGPDVGELAVDRERLDPRLAELQRVNQPVRSDGHGDRVAQLAG